MKKIFISYARKYEEFARKIAASLSGVGVKVWLDVQSIPAGMNWSHAIQEGLDTADMMIVIITPESLESRNVESEWQYFISEGKPVIPILLISSKINFQLRQLQYIDFQNQDYDVAFQELCEELRLISEPVTVELPPVLPRPSLPARSEPIINSPVVYQVPRFVAFGFLVVLIAVLGILLLMATRL